jgi:hypothetical protein
VLVPNKKLMVVKDGQKVGSFIFKKSRFPPLSTFDFDKMSPFDFGGTRGIKSIFSLVDSQKI